MSSLIRADEDRPRWFGMAVLHKNAEAARHFLIGFNKPSEVAAAAVLVELVLGHDVPEPAAIRPDLVGQHNADHLIFEQTPKFDFEVDEADADAEEEAGEEVVDPQRQRHDLVDLLRIGPAEGG